MKLPKTWVNKKSPTNPVNKQKHLDRKFKVGILREIETREQQQDILEFKKNAKTHSYE